MPPPDDDVRLAEEARQDPALPLLRQGEGRGVGHPALEGVGVDGGGVGGEVEDEDGGAGVYAEPEGGPVQEGEGRHGVGHGAEQVVGNHRAHPGQGQQQQDEEQPEESQK